MQPDNPMKAMLEVIDLIASAGGMLVGRTRLQKTQAILESVGLGCGFEFVYKHYGPFSQELVEATETAELFGEIREERLTAQWGGTYSKFFTNRKPEPPRHPGRASIISIARDADPIELELAATAIFLAKNGCSDAWDETVRRKPEKADATRLAKAKQLYDRFSMIKTPEAWPL